ncbi:uncharacterized protein LOC131319440 isoform X1 [Rhododendron vialii]|uniref:uncharacterized protein LOC131319440 isoform X1 n=1 Tax=Rhododendron vialii TaxID=182163 RepID=UPI00265ECD05|nr:uncharacterized protein LOC131319440 isoform X1 [Rhododendron vialii]
MNNNSTITFRQTLFPNPQRGRCICFRTVNWKAGAYGMAGANGTVSFYSIPFDFFGDGGDDDDDVVNSSNPDVEGLLPFYEGTDFPISSTLSSVGSSLFVVGDSKECMRPSLTTFKIYQFDTTAPADGWRAISMLTPRTSPQTVVMDGKLYVFFGGPYAPFAEMFDPCSISSTSVPLPPPPVWLTNGWWHMVIAALQPSKKILVASSDFALVYNVVDHVWEDFDHVIDFSDAQVQGQAAVVRNSTLLCWCTKDRAEVHAYDLVLRRWFQSPINGLDRLGPDEPSIYLPLFPLDDNHLCFLWEKMGYEGTILPLVHCTKIQVSLYKGAGGEYRLDVVVVASQSYVLHERNETILDAHVFLGEEDEGGEKGSGLGCHDHGGRTLERCGYAGGGRIAIGIAPFKMCFKCWLPGHMEKDCKGIPWYVGGGQNVSSSGGQPSLLRSG